MPRQLRVEYPGAIYQKQKVELARLLREETTLALAWIAQRLSMGSCGYVSHLLKRKAKSANIEDTWTTPSSPPPWPWPISPWLPPQA